MSTYNVGNFTVHLQVSMELQYQTGQTAWLLLLVNIHDSLLDPLLLHSK